MTIGLTVFLMGCAGTDAQRKPPEWQLRVDDLGRSQARMAARLDEMAQALQALRDRMGGQEDAVREVRKGLEDLAAREETAPAMPVIRVEPLPNAAPAEPPGAQPPVGGVSAEPAALAAESEQAGGGGGAAPDPTPAADLYRRAYSAFREARYGQAILDFEEFLRRYPDSEYADNAQYWIGECYYSQSEYAEAVAEFGRVVERFPRKAKAPDALLKMGLGYEKLGEPDQAREAWRRVTAAYGDSEAAAQARNLLGAAR